MYNLQVYEIVERVDELKKKWPEAWGAFDNNGISIVAPYSDQVCIYEKLFTVVNVRNPDQNVI